MLLHFICFFILNIVRYFFLTERYKQNMLLCVMFMLHVLFYFCFFFIFMFYMKFISFILFLFVRLSKGKQNLLCCVIFMLIVFFILLFNNSHEHKIKINILCKYSKLKSSHHSN